MWRSGSVVTNGGWTPVEPGARTSVDPVTIYLIVGLPGAGKTARAKELEIRAPY